MKYILLFVSCTLLGILIATAYTISTSHVHPQKQLPVVFSLATPPHQSLTASLLSWSLDTTWQSRTATDFASLQAPHVFSQGEALATGKKGKASLVFAHRLTLSLLPSSTLSLIQTLPASLVMSQRNGTITYTSTGLSPVAVRALDLLVNDDQLGSFTITVKLPLIMVIDTLGSVSLAYTDLSNTTETVTLRKGQQAIFNDDTAEMQVE